MNRLRIEQIRGRDRNIFKCDCGQEIFFTLFSQVGDKKTFQKHNVDSTIHECNSVRKISRKCFSCGEIILIFKTNASSKWQKENSDGSKHECDKKATSSPSKYFCHDCDRMHWSDTQYECVTDRPGSEYDDVRIEGQMQYERDDYGY